MDPEWKHDKQPSRSVAKEMRKQTAKAVRIFAQNRGVDHSSLF